LAAAMLTAAMIANFLLDAACCFAFARAFINGFLAVKLNKNSRKQQSNYNQA